MSDTQAKLNAACTLLLQTPPGEVNDVLADLRGILAPSGLSDAEIDAGLRPALKQFHETQFTPVKVDGEQNKVLVTPANKTREGEGEDGADVFVAPNAGVEFAFDSLAATASALPSSSPSPFDAETESTRRGLDELLATHVSNHYAAGVSAVYVRPDPAFPPPEPVAAAPAAAAEEEKKEGATAETGDAAPPPLSIEEDSNATPAATEAESSAPGDALAEDVTGPADAVAETAAETANVAGEALVGDSVESANGEPTAMEGQSSAAAEEKEEPRTEGEGDAPEKAAAATEEGQEATDTEDKMDVEHAPAEPAAETEGQEAAEPQEAAVAAPEPRPSKQFGLYFVGSKYNPNNYWTGRWRSTYALDRAQGTLEGTAQVNVHYYEQSNIQLSTTFKSTSDLGPDPSAESVIASIKASESSFQRQLGETYNELSDATLRGLRRALPKTRSKLDWDRAAGYKLGRELGGGGGGAGPMEA
ncbi:hypothetical protein JCM8202_002887 [Rhodotorula sphaerocarpa]